MQLVYIIVYSFLQSSLERFKCTIIKNVHYMHKLRKCFFFFLYFKGEVISDFQSDSDQDSSQVGWKMPVSGL